MKTSAIRGGLGMIIVITMFSNIKTQITHVILFKFKYEQYHNRLKIKKIVAWSIKSVEWPAKDSCKQKDISRT